MQKWWSLFFATVLLACFCLSLASPALGWWLPAGVSSYSADVDRLFYEILILTTIFFVLTEVILVVAMFRYTDRSATTKALYVHGSNKLELLWTIIPAILLVYIAYAQISVWNEIKLRSRMDARGADQVMQVTGRQWEWRIRYPTPDKVHFTDLKVPTDPKEYAAFVAGDAYADLKLVEGDHTRLGRGKPQLDDLRRKRIAHLEECQRKKVFS